ncbi:glutathione-disulfide reductase [Nitrosococcus halophilus Nc 4]|uniref:Glutathione reductase n=1 Tax=Nitrosococcus halophilus (strain Nc4) TaxID=472759 RepID=D5BZX5_NITHN|nr:glutathione-disulfide reductase [Nitrosococcus halophilus]ADE16222.1 glutathione-disulfide reductase [Nitrosococcus halophilus Nc 4]
MTSYDFDLFVIGAGSGGVRAARMSASFGARVAIAEERYLGGTCVNVGCVPKKLLLYGAHFSEDFEDAAGFGWRVGQCQFDWPTLIQNKNTEIERLNQIYESLLRKAGVTLVNGRACLETPHTVLVDGQRYTAERILIATGSWPAIPEFPGREHVITSNEAFFLDRLPRQVAIVGGGYIAVEFASIFNGLGSETTLLYRGPLFLRGFDEDLREGLAQEMAKRNIKLRFNTEVAAVEKEEQGFTVRLHHGEALKVDTVMYATGRTPNTRGLGLEELGVELSWNGAIVVNGDYQSAIPSIYGIGDVTHRINLTPVALAEAMVLARNLYGGQYSQLDYDNIPACVFSQPNVATVGLTEEQARERCGEVSVYRSTFRPLKHTLSGRDERMMVKLIVEKATDRVVGAHMLGSDAGEIIQGIAVAIKAGATKTVFDNTLGIHPTAAEEFVTLRQPL